MNGWMISFDGLRVHDALHLMHWGIGMSVSWKAIHWLLMQVTAGLRAIKRGWEVGNGMMPSLLN